jgi:hypothetical protein
MAAMDAILSIGLGVGLAAACGLRVFLPFLILGVAARFHGVLLAPGFDWMAGTPALIALGTATALEIGAYYVPWLDHALDVIASPVAVIAGMLATGAVLTDLPPLARFGIAVVAGGGATAVTQTASVLLRLKSTALTGGIGNAIVATAEWVGAAALSLIAIAIPVAGLALVAAALAVALRRGRRARGPARRR